MENPNPEPFNKNFQEPINIWLVVIITTIITAIIIGGGVYFWQQSVRQTIVNKNNSNNNLLQNEIDDLQAQLTASQAEPINNKLPESEDVPEEWLEYKYYGYSFLYPNNWTTAIKGGVILFFDGTDVKMELQCPILEIGYEAWDFKTSQRQIFSENKSKTVDLWLGTPLNGLNPIALIFIGNGKNDGFQKSCQLAGGGYSDLFEIYEKIYNSVK